MKLLFIGDGKIDGTIVFNKGETYEVSDDTGSASRWLRRHLAVEVQEKKEIIKEEIKVEEVPVEVIVDAVVDVVPESEAFAALGEEIVSEVEEVKIAKPSVKAENKAKKSQSKKGN